MSVQSVEKSFIGNSPRQSSRHDSMYGCVQISIASPEVIRAWSHGEIKKPETINYRTLKPERDGLFCARIFGPVKDYECLCQKYKKIKYKGIVCEKCGVEVIQSKVRRERMAHIELVYPVVHTWFLHSTPSKIALLLNMSQKVIEKIIVFTLYVVIDGGNTKLSRGDTLTQEEFDGVIDEYGQDSCTIGIGVQAIYDLLSTINFEAEIAITNTAIEATKSSSKKTSLLKRLSVLESFLKSGNKPEWMVITAMPVIPPGLRPLIQIDNGKFFSSDLNELYRRLINRNNRLKNIIALDAPDIIIKNEMIMLQEAVDALIDNEKRTRVTQANGNRVLKSFSEYLRGKQGIFRQNLLGKRVDYSGRSVITAGPRLKLHQCGLPKFMALELFKPFIYSRLELQGKASSIKAAKVMIDNGDLHVWQILEEVVREYPVLLNRAPTLHRLGIQGFEPVLINSKALQLHPLVCKAFNADFDGDQMAVHVPISIEAQIEARVLMLSSNNIISPSSGTPIITPTQDIIMGLFYITNIAKDQISPEMKEKIFMSFEDINFAVENKYININSKIKYRVAVYDKTGKANMMTVDTTAGRVAFFHCLPVGQKNIAFDEFNRAFTKKEIQKIFQTVHENMEQKDMVIFADKTMQLGFAGSTMSGLSFSVVDMIVPEEKDGYVAETAKKISEFERQLADGYITQREKYNKSTDAWQECINKVSDAMMNAMSKNSDTADINSIYLLAYSGARGSVTQMKQLASMRGLMTKPSGEIIETPILSNFKEGLSVLEYFISANGARKGLADTALKTADAGYLTRRLVDVSHNCIVVSEDCGTTDGIVFTAEKRGDVVVKKLSDVVMGRVVSKDILSDEKGIAIHAGTMVDRNIAAVIDELNLTSIEVRSVVTCSLEQGVCAKCYGKDLTSGNLVNCGEPVGIIAAQSIGEPGTQLTMRTFHIGGVASKTVDKPFVEAMEDGQIKLSGVSFVQNRDGEVVTTTHSGEIFMMSSSGVSTQYNIPYGSKLKVKDGQNIKKGAIICEIEPYNIPIISEYDGFVYFVDVRRDVSFKEKRDEETGVSVRTIVESDLHPRVTLKNKAGQVVKNINGNAVTFYLPVGATVVCADGAEVKKGDIIAKVPKTDQVVKDITGGLPRVVDLFEARRPGNTAIISNVDGVVAEIKTFRSKKTVIIKPIDSDKLVEYSAPKDAHILVSDGTVVKKGSLIVDGETNAHDILKVRGVKDLVLYLLNEIQDVYKLQGGEIDNRHFEVIIKYMLQKVVVLDAGDTHLIEHQRVNVIEINKINAALPKGKRPASYELILQGITSAALQTESFISAASFQETTKVLTDAAISSKIDHLVGIKENVIVGKLIPAGTGYYVRQATLNEEAAATE